MVRPSVCTPLGYQIPLLDFMHVLCLFNEFTGFPEIIRDLQGFSEIFGNFESGILRD